MISEKWVPVSVAAKRLNVSTRTIYRLIDGKYLRGRRVGVKGCIQVRESSLSYFAETRNF